jgi:hypothetical protein
MVDRFDMVPDLPADLDDPDLFAARWQEGGTLEVSITQLDGVPAVSTVSKFQREPPPGIMVLGAVIVPRATFSHVIRVQCPEVGTTGTREAIVGNELMAEGRVTIRDGKLVGWQVGPDAQPPLLARNLADDEVWDERFPDHCLSRCRRHLRYIAATARMGSETRAAAPFRFASG